jgi:hypothetical protein
MIELSRLGATYPQRPARPDRAKQMDHATEHHYAEERQQT